MAHSVRSICGETVSEEDHRDRIRKNVALSRGKLCYATGFDNPDTHLANVKTYVRRLAGLRLEASKGLVTPLYLDYHVFRQDIMANY